MSAHHGGRDHAIAAIARWVATMSALAGGCSLDTSGLAPQPADGGPAPGTDAGEVAPGDAATAQDAGADACFGGACVPADAGCAGVETCNSLDDDCDAAIDEGEALCGDGCAAVAFESSTYVFCTGATPWDDARAYCTERGYDLVVVEGNAENEFVRSTGIATDNEWWIGLWSPKNDREYEWVDGDPNEFEFWEGDPMGQCVRLRTSDGAWQGKGCGGGRSFVCEPVR
jgi:hypothetical protein